MTEKTCTTCAWVDAEQTVQGHPVLICSRDGETVCRECFCETWHPGGMRVVDNGNGNEASDD